MTQVLKQNFRAKRTIQLLQLLPVLKRIRTDKDTDKCGDNYRVRLDHRSSHSLIASQTPTAQGRQDSSVQMLVLQSFHMSPPLFVLSRLAVEHGAPTTSHFHTIIIPKIWGLNRCKHHQRAAIRLNLLLVFNPQKYW